MVLNCFVSAANLAGVKGARPALAPILEDMVRIEAILADSSYKVSRADTLKKAHNGKLRITEKLGEGLVVTS